jgi:hypothetical protein
MNSNACAAHTNQYKIPYIYVVEAIQLLDNTGIVRRLQRNK